MLRVGGGSGCSACFFHNDGIFALSVGLSVVVFTQTDVLESVFSVKCLGGVVAGADFQQQAAGRGVVEPVGQESACDASAAVFGTDGNEVQL